MRETSVVPSAAKPAKTKEALARKSVAITGAPVRLARPRTIAFGPSTRISAPIRFGKYFQPCFPQFGHHGLHLGEVTVQEFHVALRHSSRHHKSTGFDAIG